MDKYIACGEDCEQVNTENEEAIRNISRAISDVCLQMLQQSSIVFVFFLFQGCRWILYRADCRFDSSIVVYHILIQKILFITHKQFTVYVLSYISKMSAIYRNFIIPATDDGFTWSRVLILLIKPSFCLTVVFLIKSNILSSIEMPFFPLL